MMQISTYTYMHVHNIFISNVNNIVSDLKKD